MVLLNQGHPRVHWETLEGDANRVLKSLCPSLQDFGSARGFPPVASSPESLSLGFGQPEKVLKATHEKGWGWEVLLAQAEVLVGKALTARARNDRLKKAARLWVGPLHLPRGLHRLQLPLDQVHPLEIQGS